MQLHSDFLLKIVAIQSAFEPKVLRSKFKLIDSIIRNDSLSEINEVHHPDFHDHQFEFILYTLKLFDF